MPDREAVQPVHLLDETGAGLSSTFERRGQPSCLACSHVSVCHTALFPESKGRGKSHAQDSVGVLGMIAEPTNRRVYDFPTS